MGLAVVLDDGAPRPDAAEPPTTTLNPVGMGKLEWPLTVLCPSPPQHCSAQLSHPDWPPLTQMFMISA